MTFYDYTGRAVAYSDDGENIFLFSGDPVAYINRNIVYRFNGSQLGFFENGWIRDKKGYCVFFTENATGVGPLKPIRCVKPVKSIKKICPIKSVRHNSLAQPINQIDWSRLSGEAFFYNA